MSRAQRVVLIGNSVVASSLASTLRSRPEFEVIQLDVAPAEALKRLRDAYPEAVICELASTPADLIFRLLGEYPDLLVIGVDIDGERMVVLSGRQASLRTEEDLLEAIGQQRPLPQAASLVPKIEERRWLASRPKNVSRKGG